MKPLMLQHPKRTYFGAGCLAELSGDRLFETSDRILILVAAPLVSAADQVAQALKEAGKTVRIVEYDYRGEPTFALLEQLLTDTEAFRPDGVVGIGGGSVLDCAKLLAALTGNEQKLQDVVGLNMLRGRRAGLIAVPTTSGTGSEMSPNAILLDEATNDKKGIISPDLVPDAVYLDPSLTLTLPASLTAETGMDALCHCLEAYTNVHAHPAVDLYALKGVELIGANLLKACRNGSDLEARTALSLGSMYGGLCLGPVNTAAVHALSYGLGGKYHVSHGLANAILLPAVMEFNLPACVERTAQLAVALGVTQTDDSLYVAQAGIEKIRELSVSCGIPQRLSQIGIQKEDLPELAGIALNVKRLLVNNPREVTLNDALQIFESLL